ncbi:MAG: class I SAM-dependent methyltransferase [Anaerolineae bacterium]|jgi:ubiquinone/menaquinone biosynthesis C-methylase UbiE|nr:class I SAM-dependent methyltransferase [Anaerolineae bacterium]MBT7483311.1 class I SAM-dependent methyltransferase [Candidatus Peregrinibacteria bacterium]MBT4842289.1 class I SAM-dependent methyltransferase [Anaerolineae bacterium]MBT6062832.1 class I SAM-dependent methyltransferase [Anaerolineae bacterium]MBT6812305.1 class I SAM-dependent methyltransferase [Anaerolineae bacterium]
MSEENYIGDELEVFAKADNWKSYFSRFITPHLGEKVLEVGAGIGATTEIFCDKEYKSWLCLEPDATLLSEIDAKIKKEELPSFCETKKGLVANLEKDAFFDSIIYIDVLEHIENDYEELIQASQHLKEGGKIIVLSPAYQSLYSPFDKAIGHFRRYDRASISAITPPDTKIIKSIYLDAVGVFLSFANRLFLRQNNPTDQQIQFWDKVIIPISRLFDPIIGYSAGRSILCVWEKMK